ncbi:MAG TPA: copper amine oxidase N-terminal domain-containing protein [Candidatus Flavonifractor merdigallinarum]|uniref:Copper amine oxidase N-terminal domain-containing protein n=1 Tax=Candidatus Flavonifractor merdigallinarum TaxID=2838589 RepID=A0A9D1Y925_9FIRM|nr:copper amine oxidase N-terminal domain-containing protein [Candidatus Flavonifractor merdigallinarum]
MKRFLSVLTALCLTLALSVPALAAGGVEIRLQDAPVWLGVQDTGSGSALVYSTDQGKTWNATTGDAYPFSTFQYTGRDYVCFGPGSVTYTSSDGIHWSRMPGRDWLSETVRFDPTLNSGLCTCEIELLWTGSEYMMRQKLLEDPRDTATHYGDGLRNHMVTFLDETYEVIGVKVFDGQVDAIGYANGAYSATVAGETYTFAKADWDLGQGLSDNYAVGAAGVLRKVYVDNPNGGSLIARFDFSVDGRSWVTVENTPWTTSPEMVQILPSSGGDFFVCNTYSGEIYVSSDGFTWTTHAPVTGTWHSIEGVGSPLSATYTFRLAGTGYLVAQKVLSTGGMYGLGANMPGPRNTVLTFVDKSWNEVWSYDFGAQVLDAKQQNNTWYVLVQGENGPVVWTSADTQTWTPTDQTALPDDTQSDTRFEVRDGHLWASFDDDPAYWVDCGEYALPEGCRLSVRPILHSWTETYDETMGLVVDAVEQTGAVQSYTGQVLDWTEYEQLFSNTFPTPRYYVTLDGEYLSFDTMPIAQNDRILVPLRGIAEALDFTVTWDQTTNRAVCTKGDTRIEVEIGTTNAWVDGAERPQDVPSIAYQNRTYVPLRFFSESFGLNVNWNGERNTAELNTAT